MFLWGCNILVRFPDLDITFMGMTSILDFSSLQKSQKLLCVDYWLLLFGRDKKVEKCEKTTPKQHTKKTPTPNSLQ